MEELITLEIKMSKQDFEELKDLQFLLSMESIQKLIQKKFESFPYSIGVISGMAFMTKYKNTEENINTFRHIIQRSKNIIFDLIKEN